MFNSDRPNYPDLLGFITGGKRFTVGVIEMAAAVRPYPVEPGKPFEIILLLQNTSDAVATVRIDFQMPEKDQQGQPGQFQIKSSWLRVRMRPGEVGYALMPARTLSTTATGRHLIGVEIQAKLASKPLSVRQTSKQQVNLNYYFAISEDVIQQIVALKALPFSAEQRGLLRQSIQVPLMLLPDIGDEASNPQADWVSLWTMAEHTDTRPMVERHSTDLRHKVLPLLTPQNLYKPVLAATHHRLNTVYPLHDIEAIFIARLLTFVLKLAGEPGPGPYHVHSRLQAGLPTNGRPILLAQWCRSMLSLLDSDPAILEAPIQSLVGRVFDDLLRDGIMVGFELLDKATGEAFGSRSDVEVYSRNLIRMLWNPEIKLAFEDLYLPLVIGGVLVDDLLPAPNYKPLDYLHGLEAVLKSYRPHQREDAKFVDQLAQRMVDTTLLKYGHRM
ncbi:MAG: hypothetical protein K8L99_03205 [Anaerolineae bacterium]|nr:hypothetical protein [Anaerolineae bacterium]